MTRAINFLILLCIAVEAEIGQHIYISEQKNWDEARSYCRQYYTDLSMVYSQSDQDKLVQAAGGNSALGWIGLYKDPNNTWRWSIGGELTYENWASNQPDNYRGYEETVHLFSNKKWNDAYRNLEMPFYCFSIYLVEMRRSWDEALEFCRETYSDLASLLSETDRQQAQRQIMKAHVTDPVWIGLRFLSDRWLWINNDSLVYEDWPQGDNSHQCPVTKRCGAVTKNEKWVNWDCQDKLHFICI